MKGIESRTCNTGLERRGLGVGMCIVVRCSSDGMSMTVLVDMIVLGFGLGLGLGNWWDRGALYHYLYCPQHILSSCKLEYG